mmetsp:Transcript_74374/g.131373  ORF Transcript_74374/g.131373 Transcript_74374/m.131373 type:complete len:113 (+) Transcript_74374:1195-1533(+)
MCVLFLLFTAKGGGRGTQLIPIRDSDCSDQSPLISSMHNKHDCTHLGRSGSYANKWSRFTTCHTTSCKAASAHAGLHCGKLALCARNKRLEKQKKNRWLKGLENRGGGMGDG